MNRLLASTIALLGFATLSSTALAVVDGSFDPTFATVGYMAFPGDATHTNLGSRTDQIIVESNGNLLVGGPVFAAAGAGGYWWLGELRPDGTPVLTFGESNGTGRITACSLSTIYCAGAHLYPEMIIPADGRINVLDEYLGSYTLTRTTAQAHALDTSSVAGGTGFVSTVYQFNNVKGFLKPGYALAQASSGKWLLAGAGYYTETSGDSAFGVVRLNADFSRDDSFNTTTDGNGVTFFGGQIVSVGTASSYATAVRIQVDGRILLAGSSNGRLAVARLQPNGAVDTTFGTAAGYTVADWAPGTLSPPTSAGVTLDRAGRLLVATNAYASSVTYTGMGVARFTSNGIPDTSFGIQGASYQAFPSVCSYYGANASSLALDTAGRILVAGFCATSSSRTYFFVERLFGDDGTLDTSFGISGRSYGTFDSSGVHNFATSIAFDSSGHPVLAGGTVDSTLLQRAGIARLTYDLIFTNDFERVARGRLPGQ